MNSITAPPAGKGLEVVMRPITDLAPHKSNARTHSKRQIRQIAKSIEQFGFNNPVLIDQHNTIIAGHGRVEAAKLLGLLEVPTLRLEHLSADEIRAYIIADNQLGSLAGWDRGILAIELQNLATAAVSFDVTITGFEIGEIDLLIQGPADAQKPETLELELGGPAVTRLGDLWVLGRHRVICGDALSDDVYQTLMQGDQAHLVATDPPYNVKIDGHASGLGQTKHREFPMASGEMSEAEFTAFLRKACEHFAAHSQAGSLHYIFMDWRHLFELLTAGRAVYAELKNLVVWAKDTAGMGSLYRSQHELVTVFKHGHSPHKNNVQLGKFGRNRTNVWNYPGVNAFARQTEEGRVGLTHPTCKNVNMIADLILDSTARGDLVLDGFLGSGTTLMAAERVGRACRAIELDPLYVDAAVRRWQRQTGDLAVHAGTGRHFNQIATSLEPSHD